MEGLALHLFAQKQKGSFLREKPTRWPFLWDLVLEKVLDPVDYFFAERLLGGFPDSSDKEALLLCLLLKASRNGHLCLSLEKGSFSPSFTQLVSDEGLSPLLEKMAIEGWDLFPKELYEEVEETTAFPAKPICRWKNTFYLQRNWVFETRFMQNLERLLQLQILEAKEPSDNPSLNAEQNAALRAAFAHNLLLITGGPGTGKTYTAARIVSAFIHTLEEEKRKAFKVILTAPTGKAASHLENSLYKQGCPLEKVECGTLHALLQIRSALDLNKEGGFLAADLVIVDECSMIDARLFAYFLASIAPGTRLILMGDAHQLPAVEAGSVFTDLIRMAQEGYPIAHVALTRCMRSEQESILRLAQAINQGEAELVLAEIARKESRKKWAFLQGHHPHFPRLFWESIQEYLCHPCQEVPPLESLLTAVDRFRILSCMRKGSLGVDALNELIAHRLWKEAELQQWWIAPILLTRTDYRLGLYNGEAGVLVRRCMGPHLKDRVFHPEDYAFFPHKKMGNELILFPAHLLPSFEYAFCLSVHKSQGSEYEKVLLLVPQGSEVFGREILYTAVTRARSSVEIEGSAEIIRAAVLRSSQKSSSIVERVYAALEKAEQTQEKKSSLESLT